MSIMFESKKVNPRSSNLFKNRMDKQKIIAMSIMLLPLVQQSELGLFDHVRFCRDRDFSRKISRLCRDRRDNGR